MDFQHKPHTEQPKSYSGKEKSISGVGKANGTRLRKGNASSGTSWSQRGWERTTHEKKNTRTSVVGQTEKTMSPDLNRIGYKSKIKSKLENTVWIDVW